MWDNPRMRNLLRRWWFWVLVVVVVILGFLYLPWYIPWKLEQWGIERERAAEQAVWEEYLAENEALAQAYASDPYGGGTPEETLRLYVDALQKKDYALASKYFVVEKQEEILDDLHYSESQGFMGAYLDVVSLRSEASVSVLGDGADIEFFNRSGAQVHFGQMILNPFTLKWKITEL